MYGIADKEGVEKKFLIMHALRRNWFVECLTVYRLVCNLYERGLPALHSKRTIQKFEIHYEEVGCIHAYIIQDWTICIQLNLIHTLMASVHIGKLYVYSFQLDLPCQFIISHGASAVVHLPRRPKVAISLHRVGPFCSLLPGRNKHITSHAQYEQILFKYSSRAEPPICSVTRSCMVYSHVTKGNSNISAVVMNNLYV